jgi:TRAP-type C4-dicarboxylate transport system permease small subunit
MPDDVVAAYPATSLTVIHNLETTALVFLMFLMFFVLGVNVRMIQWVRSPNITSWDGLYNFLGWLV